MKRERRFKKIRQKKRNRNAKGRGLDSRRDSKHSPKSRPCLEKETVSITRKVHGRTRKKKTLASEAASLKRGGTASYQADLDQLVSLGKRQGYVTYEQINSVFPRETTSSERIEEILNALSERNIEVTTSPIQKGAGVEEESQVKKERKEIALPRKEFPIQEEEYERARMDDPVRTYLRQMGQIPLLTREHEIALAKRIEDEEAKLATTVFETKAARYEVF